MRWHGITDARQINFCNSPAQRQGWRRDLLLHGVLAASLRQQHRRRLVAQRGSSDGCAGKT